MSNIIVICNYILDLFLENVKMLFVLNVHVLENMLSPQNTNCYKFHNKLKIEKNMKGINAIYMLKQNKNTV